MAMITNPITDMPPITGMTETITPGSQEHRMRRALYRATHRGTKELDWLVGRYVEACLPGMSAEALDAMELFLTVQDPQLHAWIMKPELIPPAELAGIVADIRAFHGLKD